MSQNNQNTEAIQPPSSAPSTPCDPNAATQASQGSPNTGGLQVQLDQALIRIAELENQSNYTYSQLEGEIREKNALKHELEQTKAERDRFMAEAQQERTQSLNQAQQLATLNTERTQSATETVHLRTQVAFYQQQAAHFQQQATQFQQQNTQLWHQLSQYQPHQQGPQQPPQ